MKLETRILPFHHKFVQKVLRDFRVQEQEKSFIAAVENETKFDGSWEKKTEQIKKVFIRFHSKSDWLRHRVPFLTRWISALRLHYLSLSLLPQLLVLGVIHSMGIVIPLWLAINVCLATSFLHLSCNLWNDYEDHLRGVDHFSDSSVIEKLWIPAIHLRNLSIGLFLLAACIAFYILASLGWNSNGKAVLAIGSLGGIAAAGYSAWPFHYKYFALGELLAFFLCGPLIAFGTAAVFFTKTLPLAFLFLISIPLSLQVVLRIHGGNIRRIPGDIQARVKTVASTIGFYWSKYLYILILFFLYLSVPAIYSLFKLSPYIFLSYLSLPVAIYQLLLLKKMKSPWDPYTKKMKESAKFLDYSFGLLYSLSFFLAI